MAEETWPLVRAQAREVESLGRMLGVVLGGPTHLHEASYECVGLGGWSPMLAKLEWTLWDYSGSPSDMIKEEDIAPLLAQSPQEDGGVLRALGDAMNVGNPVARYLCTWQALAFHVGTDVPSQLDSLFFDRVQVPRDCSGRSGPESRYTHFRNMLSHPQGRDIPTYEALDARARELVDDLALLLLRDLVASWGE
ncbi:MAG: hypothetical protein WBI91_00240 [Coriobacteriia bacterium]